MKKILLFLLTGSLLIITSCGGYQQPNYVQSSQPYQVMTNPITGQQQVLYSMSGTQYIIPYLTFMGWYNMGGYGYVNSMYNSNRTYFGSYNRSSYNGWRSSSFRDTYKGPAKTYSNTNSYSKPNPSSNSFGTSSRQTSSGSSFGSSKRNSTPSPSPSSSFGSRGSRSSSSSSSSSSRSSSFGSRGSRH